MSARIVALKTNGVVEEHVEGDFAMEVGSVAVEEEDVTVGEGEARLGKAVVKGGLEEGAHEAMFQLIRGVTATEGAGFLNEAESPVGTPLVHVCLDHVHQEAGFHRTFDSKEL